MTFPAKYDSADLCPGGCGYRIRAGESVTYNESDELVHADCTPRVSPFDTGPHETICPDCFCIRPCRCVDD